jgi:multicomponent K+:H+ antiporter subunit F
MIVSVILPLALLGFALALAANCWRLLRGPGPADRVLALDTLYVNALALLMLLGIQWRTALFFEAALVIAALGFVGTVALSKYIVHGDIVD